MTSHFDAEAIGSSVSKCSSVMAGDASNPMVQRIYRSITFRRAANWEAMRKKISSPFAVHAICKSMGRTVQSCACRLTYLSVGSLKDAPLIPELNRKAVASHILYNSRR
jgi:hypothetical protein